VDPRNPARVLLATDRSGVLASNDGGANFSPANHGFAHRQVASVLVDRSDNSTIYVGLLNDKEWGGVFVTHDAGQSWAQMSDGLAGRDIFVLRQAQDGSLIAGTNNGLLQLPSNSSHWQPLNMFAAERAARTKKIVARQTSLRINDLELGPQKWYAATSAGLFTSTDHGHTWSNVPGLKDLISVSAVDTLVVAASRTAIMFSLTGGESWLMPAMTHAVTSINAARVDSDGTIWLATREGAFRSTNGGDTWDYVLSLHLADVVDIRYDQESRRLLATGAASTSIFESLDHGRTWHRTDSGWLLRNVVPANGRLVAATAFDGIVVQPESAAPITEVSRTGGNR
jgi:photosystem II stability/assembly factor-like uncharacterized protein